MRASSAGFAYARQVRSAAPPPATHASAVVSRSLAVDGSIDGAALPSHSKNVFENPNPISRNPTSTVPAASTATVQNIVHGASPWPECRCSDAYWERSP